MTKGSSKLNRRQAVLRRLCANTGIDDKKLRLLSKSDLQLFDANSVEAFFAKLHPSIDLLTKHDRALGAIVEAALNINQERVGKLLARIGEVGIETNTRENTTYHRYLRAIKELAALFDSDGVKHLPQLSNESVDITRQMALYAAKDPTGKIARACKALLASRHINEETKDILRQHGIR